MKVVLDVLSKLNGIINQFERNYYGFPDRVVEVTHQEMIDICHEGFVQCGNQSPAQWDFDILDKKSGVLVERDDLADTFDNALRYGYDRYQIRFRNFKLLVVK